MALLKHHEKMLVEESAISPEVIEENGYYSITDQGADGEKQLIELGFPESQVKRLCPRPGLVIPVWHVDGRTEPICYVYRPDDPPEFKEYNISKKRGEYKRKKLKYVWPKDTPPALYCPPRSLKIMKDNNDAPIYWTEGQKKTDALVSQVLCAIGLPNGVWGWRNKRGALADFEYIPLDRDHIIIFDNDAASKPEVAMALERFSNLLRRRARGKVSIGLIPPFEGVKGIDDFFGAGYNLEQFHFYIEAGRNLYGKVDDRTQNSKRVMAKDFEEAFEEIGYELSYNTAGYLYMVNGICLDDNKEAELLSLMLDYGARKFENMNGWSKARIEIEMKRIAGQNEFNPIKLYFDKCYAEWDCKPGRIERLCQCFIDDNEEEYRSVFKEFKGEYLGHEVAHIFIRRWLIGVVSKLFNQTQNMMLIFVGEKGMGKSYFLRWLASGLGDEYAVEEQLKPDDKDTVRRMTAVLLWEVPELGSTMRKADVESLKRIITQKFMHFRAPYHRKDTVAPAIVSFMGSVNDDGAGFLHDSSGKDRRYWPVTVNQIERNYSSDIEINQLWGEVMALMRSGVSPNLSPQESDLMRAITDRYESQSPYYDYIVKHYTVTTDPTDPGYERFVATSDIISLLKNEERVSISERALQMEIARSMKSLGARKYQNSDRERGYKGVTSKGFVIR